MLTWHKVLQVMVRLRLHRGGVGGGYGYTVGEGGRLDGAERRKEGRLLLQRTPVTHFLSFSTFAALCGRKSGEEGRYIVHHFSISR